MDSEVKFAAANLKSAFGINVDVMNMTIDEFMFRFIKYFDSCEGTLSAYKTKLQSLADSWKTLYYYMKANELSENDESDTDDDVHIEFEKAVNSWLKEAKTDVDLKRKIANWTKEQLLITEEERQKTKLQKKKQRNENQKPPKRADSTEFQNENAGSGVWSDEFSSMLDKMRIGDSGLEVEESSRQRVKRSGSSSENNESPTKVFDSKTASGYTYGRQGNFRAEMGQFEDAIKCYTNAIQLLPQDSKLYGNRSCCYEKLERYDKALEDANKAIELDPTLHMNYFRKGLALSGLKRYRDAEKAFKEVMKLDPQCCFPLRELMLMRKAELVDMGFDEKTAYSAACMFKTVQDAINAIVENKVLDDPADEIYMSEDDDGDDEYFEKVRISNVRESAKDTATKDSIPLPSIHQQRPSDVTVWVGNILTTVENPQLHALFSKCGDVKSIKVFREKSKDDCHCAFIDFVDSSSVNKAMAELNGYNLEGKFLVLRIPHKPISTDDSDIQSKPPRFQKQTPPNGECYFWRTTGNCRNGTKCCFKHVPEHKLIDKK